MVVVELGLGRVRVMGWRRLNEDGSGLGGLWTRVGSSEVDTSSLIGRAGTSIIGNVCPV